MTQIHPRDLNQRSSVSEALHIPLEHLGRAMPIVVRMIAIEKSVLQTCFFGAPFIYLRLCIHLSYLPLAPRHAEFDGAGSISHDRSLFAEASAASPIKSGEVGTSKGNARKEK